MLWKSVSLGYPVSSESFENIYIEKYMDLSYLIKIAMLLLEKFIGA